MTIRRLKTYAGAQGYVYQYYFVGKRASVTHAATRDESPLVSGAKSVSEAADEYIFDVTSDRRSTHAVSVLLPQEVLQAWSHAHGRSLSDAEQYAAVKMRLFRAFAEGEVLSESQGPTTKTNPAPFTIDLGFLDEALAGLGIE